MAVEVVAGILLLQIQLQWTDIILHDQICSKGVWGSSSAQMRGNLSVFMEFNIQLQQLPRSGQAKGHVHLNG